MTSESSSATSSSSSSSSSFSSALSSSNTTSISTPVVISSMTASNSSFVSAPKVGLSFSLASNKLVKRTPVSFSEKKEIKEKIYADSLTSKDLAKLAEPVKKEVIIPLIKKNEWKKPELPGLEKVSDTYVSSSASTSVATLDTASSIQLANANSDDKEAIARLIGESKMNLTKKENKVDNVEAIPLLMQNEVPGIRLLQSEDEKMKYDVDLRPDAPDFEAYERISIDDFGVGMLKGMGWKEGGTVGKGKFAKAVDPVDVVSRAGRLGLGADAAVANSGGKKGSANGNTTNLKSHTSSSSLPPSASSSNSNSKKNDFKKRLITVSNLSLNVGGLVELRTGPHAGEYARVLEISHINCTMCNVKLKWSETVVHDVQEEDLIVLDEFALPSDHPALLDYDYRTIKAAPLMPSKHNSSSSPSLSSSLSSPPPSVSGKHKLHDDSRDYEKRDCKKQRYADDKYDNASYSNSKSSGSNSNSSSNSKKISWVRPSIRVRVINKKLFHGSLYNQKVVVADIVSPHAFSIITEEGKVVEDMRESDVETYVPVRGKRVMILSGRHCGWTGILADSDKSKYIAYVQLDHNEHEIKVDFDHCSEYVGQPASASN